MTAEGWWPDEDEYRRYLEVERRLFALALTTYGGMTAEQADLEALQQYPYQPPEASCRGLVFHELAWHWAMVRLYGDDYWKSHPEFQVAPEAHKREAARLVGILV